MEGILPPKVQWRLGKANLSTNVKLNLLSERLVLEDIILHRPEIIAEYVDIAALQAAYQRYIANPLRVTHADLFTVFLSVNLALWLQQADVIR
jgi:asparagine synthase (glutamine-hydrolysing)